MRYHKLDLNLLVALDALLAECNVSRAALRLNLGQSALSAALGRLRDHFGDELLVQVGRRMVPTALAESLREPVHDILARVQGVANARAAFDPATAERTFTVACSDYVIVTFLPHVHRRLAEIAPHVHLYARGITNLVSLAPTAAELLDRGNCDFVIVVDDSISPDHPSEVLFTDDYVCIAWVENPLSGPAISLEDYLAATHVGAAFGDGRFLSREEVFLRGIGHHRKVGCMVDTFTLIPELVVGTWRIATVQSRLARLYQDRLPLKTMTLPFALPPLIEVLQWQGHRESDPALNWFRTFLQEAALETAHESNARKSGNRLSAKRGGKTNT